MFTKDSEKILELLFNIDYDVYNNMKNYYTRNHLDKDIFLDLFNFLEERNKNIDLDKILSEIVVEKDNKDIAMNKFIPTKIQECIKYKLNLTYRFKIKIANKIINLRIKTDSKNKITSEKLKKIVYALAIIVHLLDTEKTIDLYIYLTPLKKDLKHLKKTIKKKHNNKHNHNHNNHNHNHNNHNHNDNIILSPREVNSGSTLPIPIPEVIICRLEEVFKLIFHELIHALNFDIKSDINSVDYKLKSMLNINPTFNNFEAYTEIWANILNSYFISKWCFMKTDPSGASDLFCDLVNYERIWSHIQCVKVLKLTNFNFDKMKYDTLTNLNAETNVWAYYILRSMVYFNINIFILDMKKHNINRINLIDDIN